jgi:hypothetical protein
VTPGLQGLDRPVRVSCRRGGHQHRVGAGEKVAGIVARGYAAAVERGHPFARLGQRIADPCHAHSRLGREGGEMALADYRTGADDADGELGAHVPPTIPMAGY